MKIELNIRLDVRNARNSIADCTKRAGIALDFLNSAFGPGSFDARRQDVQVENDYVDQLDLQQLLLVSLNAGRSFPNIFSTFIVLEELSDLLEQDCIAVYCKTMDRGFLIGSNLGDWGEGFDINKFISF
jgi:hypothetical protein